MLCVRMMGLPFRMLLPVMAVVVWLGIVAGPAAMMDHELRRVTGNVKNATVSVGTFHTTIPPERFLAFAVNEAVVTHSHVITAVNLPGALMEMPISLATTVPEEWYPKPLDWWTWMAIGTLFYCLPAWWLVGLGVEALVGPRRLRWPWAVLGGVLCGMLMVLLAGFLFGGSTANHAGGGWVFAGLGLWIVLFALLPVAWVRQRRAMRSR
jgi:hypothetical protein